MTISNFQPLSPAMVVGDTLDLLYQDDVSDSDRELINWAVDEVCERAAQAFINYGLGTVVSPCFPHFEIRNVYFSENGSKYVGLISVSSKMVAIYRVRPCGRLTSIRKPPLDVALRVLGDFKRAKGSAPTTARSTGSSLSSSVRQLTHPRPNRK